MTAVMAALNALRKLPREVWLFAAALAFVAGGYVTVVAKINAAYERGKRDAAAGVVFDSVMVERTAIRVAKQMARTDTVTERVVRTRWKVDTLITQLPPAVANVPEVKALVATVQTLTVQVDSLVSAHTAERAAWTEKAKVDSAAIYALRVIATARGDEVEQLKQRPRWRTVVGGVVTGAVLGVVAGVAR